GLDGGLHLLHVVAFRDVPGVAHRVLVAVLALDVAGDAERPELDAHRFLPSRRAMLFSSAVTRWARPRKARGALRHTVPICPRTAAMSVGRRSTGPRPVRSRGRRRAAAEPPAPLEPPPAPAPPTRRSSPAMRRWRTDIARVTSRPMRASCARTA